MLIVLRLTLLNNSIRYIGTLLYVLTFLLTYYYLLIYLLIKIIANRWSSEQEESTVLLSIDRCRSITVNMLIHRKVEVVLVFWPAFNFMLWLTIFWLNLRRSLLRSIITFFYLSSSSTITNNSILLHDESPLNFFTFFVCQNRDKSECYLHCLTTTWSIS